MRSARPIRLMLGLILLGSMATAAAPLARPGPPGLCEAVRIGDAVTLPMKDVMLCDSAFDSNNVRTMMVQVLDASTDALVHMETLRRAAVYAAERPELAPELLVLLQSRALDSAAGEHESALVWLDAGYLVGLYEQLGVRHELVRGAGSKLGVEGYAYIARAAELCRGKDDATEGAVHLAAAALTFPLMHMNKGEALPEELTKAYRTHVKKAADLAREGSLLRANVDLHIERFTKWVDAEAK